MIYFRINGDVILVNRTRSKIVPFEYHFFYKYIFKCTYATGKIILCTLSRRTLIDKHFNKYTFFSTFISKNTYEWYVDLPVCISKGSNNQRAGTKTAAEAYGRWLWVFSLRILKKI